MDNNLVSKAVGNARSFTSKHNQTITITFCDRAENHVGMQKLGTATAEGFNLADLLKTRDWFNGKKIKTVLIDLNWPIEEMGFYPNDEAYILIGKSAVNSIVGPDYSATDFFQELLDLDWDSKAYMYGRVVNKHARHNLCFGPIAQEPDYESGKGRIIPFIDVPILSKFNSMLPKIIGSNGKNMVAEGNYYYNTSICGIGYHGDSERKKVVGVRLGAVIPLVYQWFKDSEPIGEPIRLELGHGDVYIMSEKATGNDWKKKSIYTLRHAAGSKKFVNV
jgi:alkylated DNA repair dioxygenase AlkB